MQLVVGTIMLYLSLNVQVLMDDVSCLFASNVQANTFFRQAITLINLHSFSPPSFFSRLPKTSPSMVLGHYLFCILANSVQGGLLLFSRTRAYHTHLPAKRLA